MVAAAKHEGGKVICPNGLPIRCIKADGTMMEHEHADHPDYLFPVVVEYAGVIPADIEAWDSSFKPETHALIYTDGTLVITLYEYQYFYWHTNAGRGMPLGNGWRLTEGSRKNIQDFLDRGRNV